MSEELSPSTSVKKRRRRFRKKAENEDAETEGNLVPRCSKNTLEDKNGKRLLRMIKDLEESMEGSTEDCTKSMRKLRISCTNSEISERLAHKSKKADVQHTDQSYSQRSQKKLAVQKRKPEDTQNDDSKREEEKKPVRVKVENAFSSHMPIDKVQEILKNQSKTDMQYIKGELRINPRFPKHAYISMAEEPCDLLIIGFKDRNCAFEGDLVVARIHPSEKWQTLSRGDRQKTGVVVCILEKIHPRRTVGRLKTQDSRVLMYPRDYRVPLVKIDPKSLPEKFVANPSSFKDMLFLVNIVHWHDPRLAYGKVLNMVGSAGEIEAESHAILLEHGLNVTPYTEDLMEDLPAADYVPSDVDVQCREDWRDKCIFTIDPATAVDLDDAVSCVPLKNGNFEVGVHISDVTHYLTFLSPLDVQVAKRATTVYMADNVYHMLPKQLCQVCSLLPGQDKLAFSVIWEMTPCAEIVKYRFAKTIIRSCCQMAYEQAQMFIENPEKSWPDDALDVKGNYKISDLSKVVTDLFKLSSQLRERRFAGGALRIDQPKLHVIVDRSTGLPTSYSIEEQKDSNWLIEELMLLANMQVAKYLYKVVPDTALLRNHGEPSKSILSVTQTMLQKFGVHLDIESAGTLHASIKRYELEVESKSDVDRTIMKYRMMVINNLCAKAMARALYKCAANVATEEELRHYALNVPFYTHFTSPIRRYSDCVVHRLLHATIQNLSLPEEWSTELCSTIASNCNVKKYNAKTAQDRSNELYITYLIGLTGPFIAVAIVVSVKENSIDVILCRVGIKTRIYFMDIKDKASIEYSMDCLVPTVTVTWREPAVTQVINMLTILHVLVEKHSDCFRLIGTLLPPQQER